MTSFVPPDVPARRLVHSVADLQRELGISKPTALQVAHACRPVRIGRRLLVTDDSLRSYLESQREPGR